MRKTARPPATRTAFSLVELLAVMTILAILSTAMIYPALSLIERARFNQEEELLGKIADEIRASFRTNGMRNNVSALVGEIPTQKQDGTAFEFGPTGFDFRLPAESGSDLTAIDSNGWYARLARMRGQNTPTGMLHAATGEIRDIAFNAYRGRRILLVGPSNAVGDNRGSQRYLLLSFMFDNMSEGLQLPGPPNNNYTAIDAGYGEWFDRLYNHEWGSTSTAPSGWAAIWNERAGVSGLTYAQRVVAERITQPRYRVLVNNHNLKKPKLITEEGTVYFAKGETLTVYYNLDSPTNLRDVGIAYGNARAGNSVILPATATQGILAGRWVVLTRWQPNDYDEVMVSSGVEIITHTFPLNDNPAITTN